MASEDSREESPPQNLQDPPQKPQSPAQKLDRPPSKLEGSPQKLRRLNTRGEKKAIPQSTHSSPLDQDLDSSFSFRNHISASSPDDFILDITKFIPVGCLRVRRSDFGIPTSHWFSSYGWSAFPHPKDVSNNRGGSYIGKVLQTLFFNSPVLKPTLPLHYAGWIRLEFKPNDSDQGQIRVYVLPHDVGRATVDRENTSLNKPLQALLMKLDIALLTWNGSWSEDSPYFHVDPSLDKGPKDEPSLFDIFNDLPSPKPDPEIVSDGSVRDAMYQLLSSEVPGLKTTMHNYQRRSAALMLQRESNPGQIIDPRLTPQFDQKGVSWFCDIDAGLCFRDPRTFEAVRGGICAETMGLGKTLICLALILATRELSSQIPPEYSVGSIPVRKTTGSLLDMAAAQIGRKGIPWKSHLDQIEAAEGYKFERCREALEKGAGHYYLPTPEPRRESRHVTETPPRKLWLCTSTVVVCPPNLVQQWRSEIKKHTTGLNVLYLTSNSDHVPPARALAQYDIILFSKARFEKEAKEAFEQGYLSPLRMLHFKRLIVDEGHSFGNSKSRGTWAANAVHALQLSARWIVSGTPTQGLGAIGRLIQAQSAETSEDPTQEEDNSSSEEEKAHDANSKNSSEASPQQIEFFKQERCDLERLGNIMTSFLQARPWANSRYGFDQDHASWSELVMQPRHGSNSRGNLQTLRVALEGIIVRHRPEDILGDVKLPPLYQDIVYLDGSLQNKLALNTFSLMIITNAVTSERKDADYFFHPKQRKNLLQLVSNLRQASFFWSGFETEHVRNTIDNAKKFLEEKKVAVTPEDKALLLQAISMGKAVFANDICQAISKWHEMPMFIQNNFSDDVRSAWSLVENPGNPTPVGATMVHAIQTFVNSQLGKSDPTDGLVAVGKNAMESALLASQSAPDARVKAQKKIKDVKAAKKTTESPPILAGGVTVGDTTRVMKMVRVGSSLAAKLKAAVNNPSPVEDATSPSDRSYAMANLTAKVKAAFFSARGSLDGFKKRILWFAIKGHLGTPEGKAPKSEMNPASPLASTRIVSTASAKLSYLIDRIICHQLNEKIIIFYEADNVAYYIAQALECLGVKHLIYAKTLTSARRSQYVVTFNQTETFRVLLMDVSQAAFGLDMSTASRVYFVNPVFSPQIEAQAVKRAHRIGQTKPVYVETLVLNGSIEEVIVKRREAMTNEEHKKCKNILDDQTVYDWIRNVHFQSIPSNKISGPDQMSDLDFPHLLFGTRADSNPGDPDADLVQEEMSPKGKGKRKFEDEEAESSVRRTEQRSLKIILNACYRSPYDSVPTISAKSRRNRKKDRVKDPAEEEKEPEYEPLDVPQEAESSNSLNLRQEEDDWEVSGWADSEEELDI